MGVMRIGHASLKVMDAGVNAARETLSMAAKQPQITQNGWFIPRMIGAYGLDYAQRAIVSWSGGGTDVPQDMLIATATAADTRPYKRIQAAQSVFKSHDETMLPTVEAALKADNNAEAEKICSAMGDSQKAGHKEFKKDDKKKKS